MSQLIFWSDCILTACDLLLSSGVNNFEGFRKSSSVRFSLIKCVLWSFHSFGNSNKWYVWQNFLSLISLSSIVKNLQRKRRKVCTIQYLFVVLKLTGYLQLPAIKLLLFKNCTFGNVVRVYISVGAFLCRPHGPVSLPLKQPSPQVGKNYIPYDLYRQNMRKSVVHFFLEHHTSRTT